MLNLLFDPFICYGFMRRAVVACCALSLSSAPIGVFLLLRRMILIGDVLSHAILPGVAIGYFLFGASMMIVQICGLISGLLIAIFSILVSSSSFLKEDNSFFGIHLIFLSFGMLLIAWWGSDINVLNLLFGSIFSIDVYQIKFIGIISSLIFLSIALFYRALIIEIFDMEFLQGNSAKYPFLIQIFFLFLVVLNLVASFQVVGTLMSVGVMTLPALSSCYWTMNLFNMLFLSVCIALLSAYIGLLCAFYTLLPPGPIIILCNGVVFLFSIFFGKRRNYMF